MRVSREQAEENRQAVIAAASRLFRDHGFNGIGLAALMQSVGLTQGGFYKQFRSKDDLVQQAVARAFGDSGGKWEAVLAKETEHPLDALIRLYLSDRHRRTVGEGCPLVALAAESARGDAALRETFQEGVETHLALLEQVLPTGPGQGGRESALAALSTMVGALLLSRAVADEALAQGFLDAAAADLMDRYGGDEPGSASRHSNQSVQ